MAGAAGKRFHWLQADMSLRIIGIGWGRTGTLSLKSALETLGFEPCYHMTELFRQPAHASHWYRALSGEEVDWERLLRGYQAAVDYPACQHWASLGRCFPGLKYILTVRDPDQWYESVKATIYSAKPNLPGRLRILMQLPFSKRKRQLMDIFRYVEKSVWEMDFHGRFEDRAYAINRYKRRNELIRLSISPERLLVYNVAAGWAPLCRFLGVDIPENVPFPHLNRRDEFAGLMRKLI